MIQSRSMPMRGQPRQRRRRRGVAAMLAMLFLVLFGILALGFYSTITTSQQVAGSEQRIVQALAAAESGMELLRYNLALVRLRGDRTGAAMMDDLLTNLEPLLNGTPNLAGATISKSGNTISIPGGPGAISLGNRSAFRATISLSPTADRDVVVDVTGTYGTNDVRRTIRMVYGQANHVSPAFTFGLASQGGVTVSRGGITSPVDPTLADVISTSTATPAISITGGSIGGDLAVTTSKSAALYVSGSVHNSTNPTTIANSYTFVVEPPPFPTIDTALFKPYATNPFTGTGTTTHRNVRIPANTHPKFTGNAVIEGILYIESPNIIEIQGNCTVRGLIVFENAGSDALNSIDFRSGKMQQAFPPDAVFDPMRGITGIGILAPTARISMGGSATTTLLGSVIASKFSYTGNADMTIDKGTVITNSTAADSMVLNGKMISFNGIGAASPPNAAVRGQQSFTPKPDTYLEVSP